MKNSIIDSINRAVQPLDQTIFEENLVYGSTPMKKKIQQADDDELSVSTCSSVEEDDDGESLSSDSDLDEEDLIDEQVLKRAHEYRFKIRQASEKLRATRDAKLDQSLEQIQKQLERLMEMDASLEEGMSSGGDGNGYLLVELGSMEESLLKLKTRLESIDSELPDKLQSVKDTIESVSHSLNQKKNGNLSRTERAIRSRVGSIIRKRPAGVGDSDSSPSIEGTEMDAGKRFAMFVSNS